MAESWTLEVYRADSDTTHHIKVAYPKVSELVYRNIDRPKFT